MSAYEAPADVLLVEDNPGDVRLTQEAFASAEVDATLHVVRDGEAALEFLHGRGDYEDAPAPNLVLLDLNLPKLDGMGVLAEVKADPDLRRIPVVVLSGSAAEDDVLEGYDSHTNAYLVKPVTPDEFVDLVQSFEEFWFARVELPPAPEER